uniref:Secreted protein n=1 Tax=Streptomyces sp. NBC_00093 TaxID=2975649 RepID=A0AAU2A5H1_9ACTN
MGEVTVTSTSSAAPPAPNSPGTVGTTGTPAAPPAPAVPAQAGAGPAPGAPQPPRRTAFAEGVDQLRAAATTEPGRLRIIGALLAALVVAFGAVTAWQMTDRSSAADDVLHNSQPLSSAAADIYSSLADANTAASSGFLAGGDETADSRERYQRDIRNAAAKLSSAATNSEPDSPSAATIARLNELLSEYTGYIERARANNRLGFPVGGSYLRLANEKMQDEMLPEAEKLYARENQRLRSDYADATSYPWAAIGLGVVVLGALVWAQRRNYRRTNRVLNHGLVAATATATIVLLWLVAGQSFARSGLNDSYDHGIRSLNVLHDARIASLKARGNENLTLVARGAETTELKDGSVVDAYDNDFNGDMSALGKGLAQAERLADDSAGKKPVTSAVGGMEEWEKRHDAAQDAYKSGDFQQALAKVIGGKEDKPTGECFDNVDTALKTAIEHEQTEFRQAAGNGRDAMIGLPVGAGALAVLGAAGAVLGIGRRLSEYR